jgi:hypothetical protein
MCLLLIFVSLQGQNSEQKIRTVRRTNTSEQKRDITVVAQNENFVSSEQQEEFYYIEKDFSPVAESWVATLDGFCTNTKKSNLSHLFYNFQESANELGANSFYVEEIYYNPDTISVSISVFYLTDEEIDDNFELYPKNRIYIFGDLTNSKAKEKNVKLNGEKVKIYPLKYYTYQNSVGKEAVVSIGGFTGSKYVLQGKEEQLPVYMTVSGFEMAPVANMNGMGLSFSTGGIHPLDMNFGQFLVEVLEEILP